MSRELWRNLALAVIGLVGGLGLVLALSGGGGLVTRLTGTSPTGTSITGPSAPAGPPVSTGDAPRMAAAPQPGNPAGPGTHSGGGEGRQAALPEVGPRSEAEPQGDRNRGNAGPESGKAGAEIAPSFDLVRVEPNGESVVAGRGAPNTVVEMLVDGRPVARALADSNGQFALVPPALAGGNSEIVLRSTTADGRETRSKQSVAVALSPKRDTRPLVALTSPDRPTVVLSQPEAAAPAQATQRGPKDKAGRGGAPADRQAAADARKPAVPAEKPAAMRIVSVDAQEGGRLYVTGEAAPGATVRLYLNDTLIAPASVGPDGKVTFTIGRGVKPGAYRVRIDQVDSVSGKVRTRAEVPFVVPAPAAIAAREKPNAQGGRLAARPPEPVLDVAPAAPAVPAPRAEEAQARALSTPSAPVVPRPPGRVQPGNEAEVPVSRSENAAVPAAAPPAAREGRQAEAVTPGRPTTEAAEARLPAARADAAAMNPAKAPGAVFVAEIATASITRGNSLWQISRRTYGKGNRYTVIYDANREQIRDPDLIYPGQIFVLPGDKRG